jgi:hypothetical protein
VLISTVDRMLQFARAAMGHAADRVRFYRSTCWRCFWTASVNRPLRQ